MKLAALAVICALAPACTDPGCIRNSECPIEFQCIESACVRSSKDAGAGPATSPDGSTSPDASTSKPNDASTSKPNETGEDAGH